MKPVIRLLATALSTVAIAAHAAGALETAHHLVAVGVVGGQVEPGLASLAHHGRTRAVGQRDGVVGVVDGVGGALLIGQGR